MMKKLTVPALLGLGLLGTCAFAHQPAADIIDENVSDSPHAERAFNDMGHPDDVPGDDVADAMPATDNEYNGIDVKTADADTAMGNRADSAAAEAAIDTMSMLHDIEGRLQ